MASLFASPGVRSDSCIMAGTLQCFAAKTTGTETKPPLEKTTSGFIFFKSRIDCAYPFNTLNGSEKFLGSK